MPIVTVYGIPEGTPELTELREKIQETVASIHELELTPDKVTVFFPKGLIQEGMGDKVIVDVHKLLDGSKITRTVLFILATKLNTTIASMIKISNLKIIKTFVQCFGTNKTGFNWLKIR